MYPRALALSEVAWSPLSRKNFTDFCKRVDANLVRLDERCIKYHLPLPEQPYGSCDKVVDYQGYYRNLYHFPPDENGLYTGWHETYSRVSGLYCSYRCQPMIVSSILLRFCLLGEDESHQNHPGGETEWYAPSG